MKKQIFPAAPDYKEVVAYFRKKGLGITDADTFYSHQESQNWHTGRGYPIKNWRVVAPRWIINHRSACSSPISLTLKLSIQLSGTVTSKNNNKLADFLTSLLQSAQYNNGLSSSQVQPKREAALINRHCYDKEEEKSRAKEWRISCKTYEEIAHTRGRGSGTIYRWVNETHNTTKRRRKELRQAPQRGT